MSTAGGATRAQMLHLQKDAVRKAMKVSLQALSADALDSASLAITQRVLASALFRNSRRVGVFVSCRRLREVDTAPLLAKLLGQASRQQCFVPLVGTAPRDMRLLRIDSLADLSPNRMGVLEPSAETQAGFAREDAVTEALDIIIVPGVAFDSAGRRLGRGGGYYDALFAQDVQLAKTRNSKRAARVALAFDEQILQEVPADEEHDAVVDCIVTPTRVIGPWASLLC